MYTEREHKPAISRVTQQTANKQPHTNCKDRNKTEDNSYPNHSFPKNKVTQRLVGLEFETSNLQIKGHENSYKKLIAKGNDFDFTIDYGNLEVVTKAFQAKEKEKLIAAVNECVNILKNFKKIKGNTIMVHKNGYFPYTKLKSEIGINIIRCNSKKEISAHPQVTMGIPLDKLYSVYKILSSENQTIDTKELSHFALRKGKNNKWLPMIDHMKQAIKKTEENKDLSLKLKGLFAQVYTTINSVTDLDFRNNAGFDKKHNVWKNLFILMPRTKLFDLYNLLDEKDKKIFKDWVNAYNDDTTILSIITITQWLKGITGIGTEELATEDLQIEGLGSNRLKNIKNSSSDIIDKSMLSMYSSMGNSSTNINTKMKPINTGGIFEFRHLKGNVPLEEWPKVAEEAGFLAEYLEK